MSIAAVPEQPEPLGLDDLTAAEVAFAERKAGQSVTTLGNERFPQAGLIGALGWVLHRRTDARITYERYMESRKLNDITRELGLSSDEEPADEDADEGKDDALTSST